MACHLFISPHLDDAVLSCGATIHNITRKGERVIILTTMAGEPPEGLPSTPVIEAIRAQWASGRNLVATRRMEDARAAQVVGAQVIHLPIYEAIFRFARSGEGGRVALYPQEGSVYRDRSPGDDAHLMLFSMPLPCKDAVMLYAPIAADEHVDHRIARDWAIRLSFGGGIPLRFYEDYPGSAISKRATVKKNTAMLQSQTPPYQLNTVISVVDEADVESKINALRCYDHHFKILWNSADALKQSVRTFMMATGKNFALAERFWNVTLG
jgi:LmbE family N-acetylglucosaminyl deacetylase